MQYEGKLLPRFKRSACYREGRLPESERGPGYEGLPGHGKLLHSTTVHVAGNSENQNRGDTIRRLNKMFNTVSKSEMPTISRGRSAKDYSQDETFKALKGLPVDKDNWVSDGKEYSEENGKKMQSKIAAYAKAGAGTFKTSFRGGKVYIQKIADTYTQQRGGE